ncbi:hypothetical protein GCM10028773_21370 [Spirosoma koreense]
MGIDVEEIKSDFPLADVIPVGFTNEERQYIGTDEQAPLRFYELWTRKEAFVKAIGTGIDENFPQIPSLIGFYQLVPASGKPDCTWRVDSFSIAEGYLGAVAYDRTSENLQFYTLDGSLFTC